MTRVQLKYIYCYDSVNILIYKLRSLNLYIVVSSGGLAVRHRALESP